MEAVRGRRFRAPSGGRKKLPSAGRRAQAASPFTLCWFACCIACSAADYTGAPPRFDSSPRVAITAAELKERKSAPDFTVHRDAALKTAQPHLDHPLPIPQGYGGWAFDYACPADGATLRAVTSKEHECPKCKKRYTGDREVIAYRCVQHYALERGAFDLAWAYALSGDEAFAREVRRILLKLADDYPTYPARRDRWGRTGLLAPLGGRRYVQSLDEAVGVIRLAKAYDLTRQSPAWNDAERRRVEKDFLRATADSLLKFTQPHNHQTWYNAGLIAIASALGDADLLMQVVTMNRGVLHQLEHNVGPDGLWNEGAMAYHNYALQPLIETAEITRRLGMNLHEHSKLRAMIVCPLHAAYPNGQFPAINDSDRGDVRMFEWAFQWARKIYGAALDTTVPRQSEALEGVGLAALRVGEGTNAVCAFLDYGPHGGGHGHFDKLNLMLYANGREWLLDPGRLTYSHKEYKTWVKTTAAHNTVTVDGNSQAPAAGRLLWWKQGNGWAACAAECNAAYRGVLLRRYLCLTQSFLIDVFDVTAERAAQMDWFTHVLADRVASVESVQGKPRSPGNVHGYQHFTDSVAYSMRGPTRWDFASGKTVLRLWFAGDGPEDTFAANGIGYTIDQKVPCLIRRRHARQTRFVAVYDLSAKNDAVLAVRADGNLNQVVLAEVETGNGTWVVRLTSSGPEVKAPE